MGEMVGAPLGTQPRLLLPLTTCAPRQDSEQSSASSSLGPLPLSSQLRRRRPVKAEALSGHEAGVRRSRKTLYWKEAGLLGLSGLSSCLAPFSSDTGLAVPHCPQSASGSLSD